jgi:hypothetical protein
MCVDDIDKQVAEKNAANPTHRYGVSHAAGRGLR